MSSIIVPLTPAGDPAQSSIAVEKVKEAVIVDGHVDLPHHAETRGLKTALADWKEGPFTLAGAEEAGVILWGTALYCADAFNGEGAYRRYREVLEIARRLLGDIPLIRTPVEKKAFGTFLILENADCLADRPSLVDEVAEDGVRVVGLTHSGGNRLADGNAVRFSDGLTASGREVVKALGARGLLIDVAHLNERCFWDLMRIHQGPVVSSHTGVREVCDIPRNITLEQAKEIMERGGLVAVTVNPEMLTLQRRATTYDVYVHIDSLVQRLGPEVVGIGSDYCGFDAPAEGMEDVRCLGKIADLLLRKGYGEDGVAAIMGENWIKVLAA
jgi:membrane dipeptidase